MVANRDAERGRGRGKGTERISTSVVDARTRTNGAGISRVSTSAGSGNFSIRVALSSGLADAPFADHGAEFCRAE
jgi:hypothetical protein